MVSCQAILRLLRKHNRVRFEHKAVVDTKPSEAYLSTKSFEAVEAGSYLSSSVPASLPHCLLFDKSSLFAYNKLFNTMFNIDRCVQNNLNRGEVV